ncbi:hypothetical protein K1719_016190 [Acacia pycnantha]|nr:hypothetical protein K1719_016190 [Acacia pycnantha]
MATNCIKIVLRKNLLLIEAYRDRNQVYRVSYRLPGIFPLSALFSHSVTSSLLASLQASISSLRHRPFSVPVTVRLLKLNGAPAVWGFEGVKDLCRSINQSRRRLQKAWKSSTSEGSLINLWPTAAFKWFFVFVFSSSN